MGDCLSVPERLRTRTNWPAGESAESRGTMRDWWCACLMSRRPASGCRFIMQASAARHHPVRSQNELRHLPGIDLSAPVGKRRSTRKENHQARRVPAPADSNAGPMLPDTDKEGRPCRSEPSAGPGGGGTSNWGKTRLLGLLIFLLAVGVFLPALRHDFIYYDDPGFVMDNSHVQDGLTWGNVKWAFLSADVDYWRPLSWLSHMADCQVFGLEPWGHHLTSVLLHALNTLLVFVVLRKLTGAVWRSLLVAALFGLHPLHVESVAWIAERKDVLSTLFWLLTMWAYAHWVRRREAQRPRAWVFYGLALAFFSLGLMSKPMLVTVPCVLLLLDFWPLQRFDRIPGRPPLGNSARVVGGPGEAGPAFAEASAGRPGSAHSTSPSTC